MSTQTLSKLFHIDTEKYRKEYQRRYNSEESVHLDIMIGENKAFFCTTSETYKKIISIERSDKLINKLCSKLPGKALEQFAQRCLIDEIIISNNIEGVHSTRREIAQIISELEQNDYSPYSS